MKTIQHYTCSVPLRSHRKKVFKSLTKNIEDWWGTCDTNPDEEGKVFKVSFGTDSFWSFKVVELIPFEQITWQCVDSQQDHHVEGMDEEWMGTMLYWTIGNNGNKVHLTLEHEGLTPDGVCYDICSRGWDFYIMDSLKRYLETGQGEPYVK
ncbi:SRPBCC family protein [Aquimarina intermedia]|uniref:Activator of Hsp90 ATPase-like protein n=1 Tax=Aquimarina intermedia TaxID=350814 RepID=A0A5S5CCC7_9FLAO|nr:SRPBCC domain-containing protein [Aquimarina intermedia]TYP76152.1 activator of Hsp90 ATPase-like protein [Aquimarina intermedia]